MRVELLGTVAVRSDGSAVRGNELGGRRALVVLAALALASRPVAGEVLAGFIWGEELPPTWAVALRGVVRGLRVACVPVGGGEQHLITTTPSGYCLAGGVEVDVGHGAERIRQAAALLDQGRHQQVLELATPVSQFSGELLLPGHDADWLAPHRRSVDALALRAVQLVVEASGMLGRHQDAIASARSAVESYPFDESTHRALISALRRSGDRAGAVRAYEQCRTLLAEQLGIDPSAETVEVYLQALKDQPGTAAGRVPVVATSFIGRSGELAALANSLSSPGLVTVTGKGGVGKSRLALQATVRALDFAGGRLWVSLAQVAQDELVAASAALAVGVDLGANDPEEALADHFAPLGRVLLVLDGCEGVVDGAASLASTLLARAPSLTIVATSRLPLSVEGEQLHDLQPLPTPASDGPLEANGQIRLLVDRVREAGGNLVLDDAVAPHVIALCRRCGGLPLALELVAGQLAAMPVGDLLEHLDGPIGEDAVRAVARSSYELLEEDEAAIFRRLGVLDGPVGLPLLREVVSAAPIAPVRVVRILRELAARGLVSVDRRGPVWRYEQDDDLHRFARDLLVRNGGEWATFGRLAAAIRARLPDDARASPAPFRADVTELLGSVRSLFGAAIAGRAELDRCQELAFRLHRYFAATNVNEGRFWLARLLAAGEPGPWSPYATYALGYLSYWSGDTDDAMRELGSAVRMLDGAQDTYRARALIFLAGLLDDVDRGEAAIEHVRLAIEAAAPFDVDLQCSAAMGMGSVLAERVDASAARYAVEAIGLCRAGGSADQLAIALPTASMICWQVGELAAAREFIAEALPLNADTRRIARVVLLSAAAGVCLADGDIAGAVEFGTNSLVEATDLGIEREVPLIRVILARSLLVRDDLVAAAEHAAGALHTALAMSVDFPLATGLETAALVLHAAGIGTGSRVGTGCGGGVGVGVSTGAEQVGLGELLGAAAQLRRRGDRPSPAPLAEAVDDLGAFLGAPPVGAGLDARAVADRTLALLARTVSGATGFGSA